MILVLLLNLLRIILLIHIILKLRGKNEDDGTKNIETMVPLKYLSNFWRTLEMTLVNCEINLILSWSSSCVIVSTNLDNQRAIFEITDTKFYVLVVTLSTQDNARLLQQLESGFKRIVNGNKCLPKPQLSRQNTKFRSFS